MISVYKLFKKCIFLLSCFFIKIQAGQWISPLPEHIIKQVVGKSWQKNAPVPLENLAYVQVEHWDFSGKVCTGELICHVNLAQEFVDIFQELFDHKYSIHKITLIDNYNADDEKSMEDNNTSVFCSRAITGRINVFSEHSYGGAIDINPQFNPYIKGTIVLPVNGKAYVDRALNIPGMIHEGDICYQAFIKRGYRWGGHWKTLKDYQHFEKPRSDFIKENI